MKREGQYFLVPLEWHRLKKVIGLSQTDICVLACIKSMCDNSDDGRCWWTNEQFSDIFQMSERQVRNCIGKLVENQLIKAEVGIGKNGFSTRNCKANEDKIEELIEKYFK